MTDSTTSTESTTSARMIDEIEFELLAFPEKVTCLRGTLWALRDSVLAVEMAYGIECTTHSEVSSLLQLDGSVWNSSALDEKIDRVKNALWVSEGHLMNVYSIICLLPSQ